MHGCSILSGGIFSDRYSYFNFSFEPHYHNLGGSKFHGVACLPAIVLPGENPLWRRKTAIQKYVYKISPEDISGGRGILLYSHFSGGKFYRAKTIAITPGWGTTRGLLSDKNSYTH